MKLTLHRALSELKTIDKRIKDTIISLKPVEIYQKDKKIKGHIEKEEFEKQAIANFDSIIALIKRKNLIKCAIVLKNATTKVTINGEQMSIAEAITYKDLLQYKKELIDKLHLQFNAVKASLEKNNFEVSQQLQKNIEAMLGKDNVKSSKEDIETLSKPFLSMNEWHLVDPLKVEDKINTLVEEYNKFYSEVDSVLSEANAITTIEIE